MKQTLKKILSIALLVSTTNPVLADSSCAPCKTECNPCANKSFHPRAQSFDGARELVGWQTQINKYDMDRVYGSMNITYEFSRTFREKHIADYFFGCFFTEGSAGCDGKCDSRVLKVQGSAVANRDEKAWLADYFGLARQFEGELTFKPRIQNHIVDFNFYIGLDEWTQGLWFRIHAPVVHTRWDMNLKESVTTTTARTAHPAGYMQETRLEVADQVENMTQFFAGGKTFGDMKTGLCSCLIPCDSQTETGFGELAFILGYNFALEEDYHVGLGLRASAPTGTTPEGKYLFDPIVGNGKHWTLGGNFTSHYVLWRSEDEEKHFAMYVDANVEHLFKKKQKMCFDLCGNPMSRYILIEELGTPVPNDDSAGRLRVPTGTNATLQYTGNLFHLASKSTLNSDVYVPVQGEFVLKFAYQTGNVGIDLGYKLWGRSGERCKIDDCDCEAFQSGRYALKGDAQLYGFVATTNGLPANTAIKLNATQSKATITGGQKGTASANTSNFAPAANALINANADNAALAKALTGDINLVQLNAADTAANAEVGLGTNGTVVQQSVNGSNRPITLQSGDLDTSSGPSAMSHTIFAHLGYTWMDNEDWIPYLGIGANVEFASKRDDVRATASQWGVWIKGGVSFN